LSAHSLALLQVQDDKSLINAVKVFFVLLDPYWHQDSLEVARPLLEVVVSRLVIRPFELAQQVRPIGWVG
jgi:hypothetical protein